MEDVEAVTSDATFFFGASFLQHVLEMVEARL
jgi:hypothetical protein